LYAVVCFGHSRGMA